MEIDPSGGAGALLIKAGDQMGTGVQTYTNAAGRDMSVFGSGVG